MDSIKEHLEHPESGISARHVGYVFQSLGLKTKQDTESRRSIVQWDNHRIAILCRRYGLPIPPNNASDASPVADILHQHPSPESGHPSDASTNSTLTDTKSDESEGSEGCEASFLGMDKAENSKQNNDEKENPIVLPYLAIAAVVETIGCVKLHVGAGPNGYAVIVILIHMGMEYEGLMYLLR